MPLSAIQNWISRLTPSRVMLLLALLGLAAYANAVNHPFVHDDIVFIKNNPHIQELNVRDFFRFSTVTPNDFSYINFYYRPLLEFVNRVLYKLFQLNPYGYHLFNIFLHIANSYLVFRVICVMLDRRKTVAFMAAVIFLLHPVQSEAVACIAGISNLLFTFLSLLSFYWYLRAQNSPTPRGKRGLYGLSLGVFFLALLAKEQSVVLPFLLLAYEVCFRARGERGVGRLARRVGGYFVVVASYFVLRKMLFGLALSPVQAGTKEFWLVILAIPRSVLIYLGLIFFPRGLHYYRSQDVLLPYAGPIVALAIIVITVIVFLMRISGPEKRWMVFGGLWFIVALAPTLNIIPMINEFSLIMTAEHFLYFPIVGVILFTAGLIHFGLNRQSRETIFKGGMLLFTVLCALFMGMTIKQNSYWRGEIPLFERTLRYQPHFGRVRFLLAQAYAQDGQTARAVEEDLKALEIMQGYADQVANPAIKKFYLDFIRKIHYHLGLCYALLNEGSLSVHHFGTAAMMDPADEIYQESAAFALMQAGDIAGAAAYYERVIVLNEQNLMAMNTLALCYEHLGALDRAEHYLRQVTAKDPQSASAKENLERFLRKHRGP